MMMQMVAIMARMVILPQFVP